MINVDDPAEVRLPPMQNLGNGASDVDASWERRGRALLRWVNADDVHALYYAFAITAPPDPASLWGMWQAMQSCPGFEPVPLNSVTEPLPAALASREAAIRGTEQFRTAYEPLGAQFASVTIENLVAPQWWVDADYVETLVEQVPEPDDLEGLFDFCFAPGSITPPLMLGKSGAVVTSPTRGLGVLSPLRIASMTPSRVTFEFDALPRPNWLWLSMLPENGGILVLNGVHHVGALLRAGHTRAFALVRRGPVQAVLNFKEPGFFKPKRLVARRPPLVRDFFDLHLSNEVRIRSTVQFMRFRLQNPPEIGVIPPTTS